MATSSSTEWWAEAQVYSGRSNPTWMVPSATADSLAVQWETLAAAAPVAPPPPLGYRGVVLHAPDDVTWEAFAAVVQRRADTGVEVRADPGRAWERRLLDTAPAGLLPPLQI
jgi:hypothetical protein